MISINMRIFKTVLLLVALVSNVQCLPVANEPSRTNVEPSTTLKPAVDHYDQSQNGTENYRIHVDGFALVFAPAETLLLASALGNESGLSVLDVMKPTSDKPKPKPEVEEISQPSVAPKSSQRPGQRLANLIIPLLRRLQQE